MWLMKRIFKDSFVSWQFLFKILMILLLTLLVSVVSGWKPFRREKIQKLLRIASYILVETILRLLTIQHFFIVSVNYTLETFLQWIVHSFNYSIFSWSIWGCRFVFCVTKGHNVIVSLIINYFPLSVKRVSDNPNFTTQCFWNVVYA